MPSTIVSTPDMGPVVPVLDSATTKENMGETEQGGDHDVGSSMEVIDPKAEGRMLRKFDVSVVRGTLSFSGGPWADVDLALRRHPSWHFLHDGHPRQEQSGQRSDRRHAEGYWPRWQPIRHCDVAVVSPAAPQLPAAPSSNM